MNTKNKMLYKLAVWGVVVAFVVLFIGVSVQSTAFAELRELDVGECFLYIMSWSGEGYGFTAPLYTETDFQSITNLRERKSRFYYELFYQNYRNETLFNFSVYDPYGDLFYWDDAELWRTVEGATDFKVKSDDNYTKHQLAKDLTFEEFDEYTNSPKYELFMNIGYADYEFNDGEIYWLGEFSYHSTGLIGIIDGAIATGIDEQLINNAYTHGYNQGYDVGRVNGYQSGYNDGFTDGRNENLTGFEVARKIFDNIGEIMDIPILGFVTLGGLLGLAVLMGIVVFIVGLIKR